MIPRIAHFIWFRPAGDAGPDWVQNVVKEFTALHPGWTVHLHRAFPAADRQGRPIPAYLRQRAAACNQLCQLADLLAAWVLWDQGGVYLDLDAIALRSFDPLLEQVDALGADAFTSGHSSGDHRLTNGLMGSEQYGASWSRVMHYVETAEPPVRGPFLRDRCYYGPTMLTELFGRADAAIEDQDGRCGMAVLPYHYFYPYSYHERERAAQCWRSEPADRIRLVGELRGRFVDGVPPYAIHLWGVDGSSHRGVGELGQYFAPPEPVSQEPPAATGEGVNAGFTAEAQRAQRDKPPRRQDAKGKKRDVRSEK